MIKQKFQQFINENQISFYNIADRDYVLRTLEQMYVSRGAALVHIRNGQQVTKEQFEQKALELSKPYLKVKSVTNYIPQFVDPRTPEQRDANRADVEKIVRFFIDKLGYVFKREHLNDSSVANAIVSRIGQRFLFEAGDEAGTVVLRRFQDGMFSKPFSPVEVLQFYSQEFLDGARTADKQSEIEMNIRKEAVSRLGYDQKANLTVNEMNQVNALVSRLKDDRLKAYTQKKLPVALMSDYQTEFLNRALYKYGLTDLKLATLDEARAIEGIVQSQMENLNDLSDDLSFIRSILKESGWVHWDGLSTTNNNEGWILKSDSVLV